MTINPRTPVATRARQGQIGLLGTAARLGVGTWFIVQAFQIGVSALDAVLGLVAANAAVITVLAVRGRAAPPLRMTGPVSHAVNLVLGLTMLNVFDVPALLFVGSASLLAAVRGYGACEMFAVSNWLRGRDDQFGCPFYLPVDLIDRRLTGRRPAC
ncbi:MAG: hypothetical protein GEV08_05505 [Acidimicrobiia bacterium]|nr:hypothetical protein [Acidimicrobiia bacterium]